MPDFASKVICVLYLAFVVGGFWYAIAWAAKAKRAKRDPKLLAKFGPIAQRLVDDVKPELFSLSNIVSVVLVGFLGVVALHSLVG